MTASLFWSVGVSVSCFQGLQDALFALLEVRSSWQAREGNKTKVSSRQIMQSRVGKGCWVGLLCMCITSRFFVLVLPNDGMGVC